MKSFSITILLLQVTFSYGMESGALLKTKGKDALNALQFILEQSGNISYSIEAIPTDTLEIFLQNNTTETKQYIDIIKKELNKRNEIMRNQIAVSPLSFGSGDYYALQNDTGTFEEFLRIHY